jgi:2-oxoglutarate ferredoxin oxidoreductase subunit alpha
MQEGLTYCAGSELPCVVVNVVRGGPGLGTIQPSQSDYFQAVKGGGHGDYHLIVLAPSSVQEMADFVEVAFDLAFKYRNPALILTDGMIGQMMEKVEMKPYKPRWTNEEIAQISPWATIGKPESRKYNIITSVELESARFEVFNEKLQKKYREMCEKEVLYETFECDDAEYLLVAYGSSARICQKSIELLRQKGVKAGLLRPITLYPFPAKEISALADRVKGILSVEMSAGQLVEDVRLSVNGKVKVEHYGRFGGMIHSPEEVVEALEQKIIGG